MSPAIRLLPYLFAFLLALCLPGEAQARNAFKDDAADDFAHSEKVSDKELSKMRGGFINMNGVMVDFNFLAQISVNGDVVQNVNINTQDLINAVVNNQQNFMQPAIVQNVNNDTLIALQQTLNLTISGAVSAANNQAQASQAAFQGVISLY